MKLELDIIKTAFGGDGIASHNGKVCFVEGALPGERVLAEVLQDKADFLKARTVEVLKASGSRVRPACPYAAHCGGCQYQHVEYKEELRLKEEQAREALQKIGLASVLRPIRSLEKEHGYRNSLTLHAIGDTKKPRALGLFARDNVSKIPVRECLIADKRFAPVFSSKRTLPKGVEDVSLKIDETGRVVSDRDETFMRIRIGGESFCVHSKGFFQANLAMTKALTDAVRVWVEGVRPETFVDLYAGVGTFSMLCAGNAKAVVAVEENGLSVQALRMNREEKRFGRMDIVKGRVGRTVPQWLPRVTASSLVFMDPPRQGLEREVAERLAECEAEALVYVSCDLMTFVRDLERLLGSSRFSAVEIVPYDMFPRTKHLELAAFLKRRPLFP